MARSKRVPENVLTILQKMSILGKGPIRTCLQKKASGAKDCIHTDIHTLYKYFRVFYCCLTLVCPCVHQQSKCISCPLRLRLQVYFCLKGIYFAHSKHDVNQRAGNGNYWEICFRSASRPELRCYHTYTCSCVPKFENILKRRLICLFIHFNCTLKRLCEALEGRVEFGIKILLLNLSKSLY